MRTRWTAPLSRATGLHRDPIEQQSRRKRALNQRGDLWQHVILHVFQFFVQRLSDSKLSRVSFGRPHKPTPLPSSTPLIFIKGGATPAPASGSRGGDFGSSSDTMSPTPSPGMGGGMTSAPTGAPTNTDGTRGFLDGDNNGDGVVDSMDDINGERVRSCPNFLFFFSLGFAAV